MEAQLKSAGGLFEISQLHYGLHPHFKQNSLSECGIVSKNEVGGQKLKDGIQRAVGNQEKTMPMPYYSLL